MSKPCKQCGSYGMHPQKHPDMSGRSDRNTDVCDVCYWRNRADQKGLTLATICDMVLGEDAPKRDDDTLVRGVRRLLNNQNTPPQAGQPRSTDPGAIAGNAAHLAQST